MFIKHPPTHPRVVGPLVNNTREVVRHGDEAFILTPTVSQPAGSPRSVSLSNYHHLLKTFHGKCVEAVSLFVLACARTQL